MRGKKKLLALALLPVLAIGCASESQTAKAKVDGLDKLGKMTVIAREDGSGTRNAFAGLVGMDKENAKDGQSDATRSDAVTADTTEAVIQKVGEEETAIGYVSMGAGETPENVKVLKVEGEEANVQNVEKGKYPLGRSFYLAYSGELNDLEQDFLTYVKGKGQDIVKESFVPIAKSSSFLSNQAEGEIDIHGSTSAAPLLKKLVDEYCSINTHAKIMIEESDSTKGLNDAMQGSCDLAMASRELKDYEKELLNYEMIAKDGIEIIVNEKNPLEDISIKQLEEIYTGTMSDWKELNED